MTYRGYHTLGWLPSDQYAQNQSDGTDRGRPNRAITPLSNAVIALTRPPAKVTTIRPNAWATRLSGLKTYRPNAGCPFARVGTSRKRRPSRNALVANNRLADSLPWYSRGFGGIRNHTSSVSSATNAFVSHSSHARTSRSRTFFSAGEFASAGGSGFGSWRASVARARLTAP